jgi:uncharacterized membrane protein
MRFVARIALSMLLGAVAGLVASLVIVWWFVDADMVMPYFLIGIFLGALAGAVTFAAWTEHHALHVFCRTHVDSGPIRNSESASQRRTTS